MYTGPVMAGESMKNTKCSVCVLQKKRAGPVLQFRQCHFRTNPVIFCVPPYSSIQARCILVCSLHKPMTEEGCVGDWNSQFATECALLFLHWRSPYLQNQLTSFFCGAHPELVEGVSCSVHHKPAAVKAPAVRWAQLAQSENCEHTQLPKR